MLLQLSDKPETELCRLTHAAGSEVQNMPAYVCKYEIPASVMKATASRAITNALTTASAATSGVTM